MLFFCFFANLFLTSKAKVQNNLGRFTRSAFICLGFTRFYTGYAHQLWIAKTVKNREEPWPQQKTVKNREKPWLNKNRG